MKSRTQVAAALFIMALFSPGSGVFAQQAPQRPAQRIIVKWRDVERVEQSSAALQALNDATARIGVSAKALRLLATGGELIELEGSVTATQLQDLIATLSADAHVEYAQADQVMQHFFAPDNTR